MTDPQTPANLPPGGLTNGGLTNGGLTNGGLSNGIPHPDNSPTGNKSGPGKIYQLDADLKRLKVKRAEIDDKDIKAALTLRIEALEAEVSSLTAAKAADAEEALAVEEEPLPSLPTPEEREAAERLIQQARVEKMRSNDRRVQELLTEAATIAPGSAEVLELLGDELVAQRKNNEAMAKYQMATRLDPNNISVGRKYANLIFQTKAAGSVPFDLANDSEILISRTWAVTLFSIVLPGGGQFVMEEYVGGGIYLGVWSVFVFWLFLQTRDVEGLLTLVGMHVKGAKPDFNPIIFVPILGALVTHIASIGASKAAAARVVQMRASAPGGGRIARPVPPVNLPYE